MKSSQYRYHDNSGVKHKHEHGTVDEQLKI